MPKPRIERTAAHRSERGKRAATNRASKRAFNHFQVMHLRLRFLIVVTVTHPSLWEDLKRCYLQKYLKLVEAQSEAYYDDGSRDPDDYGVWPGLNLSEDALRQIRASKTFKVPEDRVRAELCEEKRRTMVEYEKVYGGKEEHERHIAGYEQLPFDPYSPREVPNLLNLDGSDNWVSKLSRNVRDWLRKRGLRANWCAETLINVMARQKSILDKGIVLSNPQPTSDEWEIAWARRFYMFLEDLEKTLGSCRIKVEAPTPSLIKAWKEEWMASAIESFRVPLTTVPPKGYPRWLPDFESGEEYRTAIESAVKRELSNSPLVSTAIGDDWKKLVRRLLPKAKTYTRKISSERKARKGMKREKAKPEEVKHVVWAVQYQVMEKESQDIASQFGVDEGAVNKGLRTILKAVGLPSRGVRGRRKGKKDSDKSPRQIVLRYR